MANGMNESWGKGYVCGKKCNGYPDPVVIDDFCGDRDSFLRGMCSAGFHEEVRHNG